MTQKLTHKPPQTQKRITLLDAAVLLFNVHRAAYHPALGFEDADRTLEELIRSLDREISVDRDVVESALHACTMAKESGRFFHPANVSFPRFMQSFADPGETFDIAYNYFRRSND